MRAAAELEIICLKRIRKACDRDVLAKATNYFASRYDDSAALIRQISDVPILRTLEAKDLCLSYVREDSPTQLLQLCVFPVTITPSFLL